jgi:excisionase family DNA binding protein
LAEAHQEPFYQQLLKSTKNRATRRQQRVERRGDRDDGNSDDSDEPSQIKGGTTTKRGRGRPKGSRTKQRAPGRTGEQRVGYRVNEFARATGTARSTVIKAIRRGELRAFWLGTCRIIPASELDRLVSDAAT